MLQHALGYLKKQLDTADKVELLDLIDGYRRGTLPLAVPVTLMRHHCRRHPNAWIGSQVYLYPDPREFILRYGM